MAGIVRLVNKDVFGGLPKACCCPVFSVSTGLKRSRSISPTIHTRSF